jgi:dihydrodipicolinate synthase/N-acetylneuraminate lyase
VRVQIATFEEWWVPFSFGIGPAGEYVATLTDDERERLRERCVELLPDEPLEIVGVARVATSRRG